MTDIVIDAVRAAIGPTCAAYALGAVGLNLQFGFTGLVNLGFVGSLAVGAYGLAITVSLGGGFLLGVAIGLVASILFALVVALPTVRLRADYLAITTIAAAEILRLVIKSTLAAPVTGGVYGLQRFADGFYAINPFQAGLYALGPIVMSGRSLWLMICSWTLVAVAVLVMWRLTAGPWGRVVNAVKRDETLAASLGKRVFAVKVQVMIIGGLCGAVAGMVLAVDQQSVSPDGFVSSVTFFLFAIVILGGRGRILPPVLGAVVFWLLVAATDGVLRQAAQEGALAQFGLGEDRTGAVRNVLLGLSLIVVIVFSPEGLLTGRRRRITRISGAAS